MTGGRQVHLVTGGGGYPGFCLGKRLASMGHTVKLIDVREPLWILTSHMEFIQGDLRDYQVVQAVMKNVDCVYHMASFGMSGRDQLNKSMIEAVNIGGTENIIEACLSENVTQLVYTSTYNVVYCGEEIKNGDETLPYAPDHKFTDHYSRTKAIADRKVLAANGRQTESGKILHTCCLRLAGIYGPGETRHFPRIVSYIERGYFSVVYGSEDTLVDFLHVDNLAQAHVLAGEGLTENKNQIAAGQAYFISDDKPINNFLFFKPLVEGLGYRYPSTRVPVVLVFYFALITELVHGLIGKVYNFQPLLTRTEVYKTGVTHYFSIEKARKQLGYHPVKQNEISEVLDYYIKTGHSKTKTKQSPLTYLIVNVMLAGIFILVVMSFIPVIR